MAPDRTCASVMLALVTKDLPREMRSRVEEAFVAALTHPIEEVRWYATWGVAELWSENRELASRCVYAIATEAAIIALATAAENGKRYDQRRPYEDISSEAACRIRQLFWQPNAIEDDAYDRLLLDEWHCAEAQNRILTIPESAGEPLAAKAFARAARTLVEWWNEKEDRTHRRDRNDEAELNLARLIEQFVMRASLDVAKAVLQPILDGIDTCPDEVHSIIEGLCLLKIGAEYRTILGSVSLFADRTELLRGCSTLMIVTPEARK